MNVFEVKGLVEIQPLFLGQTKITSVAVTDMIKEPLEQNRLPIPTEVLFTQLTVFWPAAFKLATFEVGLFLRLGGAEEKSWALGKQKLSLQSPTATFTLGGIKIPADTVNYFVTVVEPGAKEVSNPLPKVPYLITGYTDSKLSLSGHIF